MLLVTFQFQFTSVNALTRTSWLKHLFLRALSFPSLSISLQWSSACNPVQCKTNKPEWRHSGLWYKQALVISKGLSQWKRSLPLFRWPSSTGRQALASVRSQSYQTELYFFKLWNVVIVSMTPAYRGGKQERRPAAVFLPFRAPWLVDIKGCKHRLHGWFLKKKHKPPPPKQPNKKKPQQKVTSPSQCKLIIVTLCQIVMSRTVSRHGFGEKDLSWVFLSRSYFPGSQSITVCCCDWSQKKNLFPVWFLHYVNLSGKPELASWAPGEVREWWAFMFAIIVIYFPCKIHWSK